jgi:UDP-glucose 4-epimerase
MKILLLGGTGFVGSHLCSSLVAAGHEVVVVSDARVVRPIPEIEYFTAGIETPHLLEDLLPNCSHVFHLASATTPGTSRLAPDKEVLGNLAPLAYLLQRMQAAPHAQLVFMSSGGAIYGNQASDSVSENSAVLPISYYGAAKSAIESFLHAYHAQTGHGVTVFRPSNLYGPGQAVRAGFGIVPTLFDCARGKKPLELWGNGEAVRDYLYIGDFIELCLATLDWSKDRREFRVFNAGSDRGYSINDLHDRVSSISGVNIELVRHPPRGVDVERIVLDSSAARQAIGWRARTSLDQGLGLTWDWIVSQN